MAKISLDIIEENDHFVAVNKPSGMLSIPDREGKETSLKQLLREKYGNIFVVHRLDRDTSGVIIFAKNEEAHQFLSIAFEDRTVEKFYEGIVTGTLPSTEGTIDQPIAENTTKRGEMLIHRRGKPSITDYKVEENFGKFSLVRFQIHTGRTHQIRVHMQFLGHPLICDETYGDGKPVLISSIKKDYKLSKSEEEERPILNRVALHAAELRFTSPNGTKYVLKAEMPKDMRALLQQLRKRVK
ncbi:RluA family pseudouridine synthase [Pseudobacter ginsenosidimutans]|uniref:Pseudouridine synthase n=1 Tax=Pseudobacter ginsenosidimutans TaxID=661488 RepID=A0A4Q7MZA6_9BACT|nr:RluA family pseudouridine synthase [Pseudobacter ginsenosidimutans]QEC40743.1 RluA family pseudouridine synthase [Pseudobacter ginsenosidimutans]RZS72530.1 23S rRNA pseudouridine955/2504/2580 synthase/23S rRNA pseudouridine1911/1915/1917 synthase [Pseudobacter ginsenosidimutans]